jgi:hypothetical protein
MEPPHAGCDGQCNLGARTEAGMGWNDLVDPHVVGALAVESALHRLQIAMDPLVIGTRHPHARGGADRDACPEPVDRQADAAETTA